MRESNPLRLFEREISWPVDECSASCCATRRIVASVRIERTTCRLSDDRPDHWATRLWGARAPVPSIEMVAGEVGLEPARFLPGYGFPHGSGAGTRTQIC